MHSADLLNGEIYYRHCNLDSGQTPLLLFMGYSGTVDSWSEPFLTALAKIVPYIAVDLPGTGRSIKTIDKDRLSYGANASDIKYLLSHLGIKKAHVLGYSYGGTVAMSLLDQFPELVRSLVLVATTLGGQHYVSPPREILEGLARPAGETLEEKTESIWKICLGADMFPRYRANMLETLEKQKDALTPGWVLREQLKHYLTFDFAEKAKKIGVPVTAISGSEDPLTPAKNSKKIAEAFSDSTYIELAGVRHMPHLEALTPFVAAIAAHLARVEATKAGEGQL